MLSRMHCSVNELLRRMTYTFHLCTKQATIQEKLLERAKNFLSGQFTSLLSSLLHKYAFESKWFKFINTKATDIAPMGMYNKT